MARRSHMISEADRERDRKASAARRRRAAGREVSRAEPMDLRQAFEDIIFSPLPDARSFFTTAGLAWMLDRTSSDRLWPTFRDHYTSGGEVDVERIAADLAIWPPIASRVAQIQQCRA